VTDSAQACDSIQYSFYYLQNHCLSRSN